jgi:RTX toxin transport system membrane fusion protein
MEDEQQGLVFPARVRIASQTVQADQQLINLSAGMSIAAEIKTGDRRVIDYLLSPLKEYQSESLRER